MMKRMALAALAVAAVAVATPAHAGEWKAEAAGLYADLMDMVASGSLERHGLTEGTPGGAWLARARALDRQSPAGAEGFLATPYGEPVVVGDLVMLGQEITAGYRSPGKAGYAALMSRLWAGAAVCIEHPQACEQGTDPEVGAFLERLKSAQ